MTRAMSRSERKEKTAELAVSATTQPGFPRWIGVQSASCVNFGSSFNLLL
jgi:hypothetical protein